MGQQLDRHDYERMTDQVLRSRLASVRDRTARADTTEAALNDAFAEQEICHVLSARGVSTDTGHAYTAPVVTRCPGCRISVFQACDSKSSPYCSGCGKYREPLA
jgi:hypothetical protein